MLVLAHAGITLGVTVLAGGIAKHNRFTNGVAAWLASFSERIDIRILLVGALLPDIIDKPVGMFFLRDTLSAGRIYSHTLLFLVILTLAGYFLYRYRRGVWLLVLAFGTLIHQILDQIWLAPRTVFWPFMGFDFDKIEITDWFSLWFQDFFAHPDIYLGEFIGLGILLWYGITLINRKKVSQFLLCGKNY